VDGTKTLGYITNFKQSHSDTSLVCSSFGCLPFDYSSTAGVTPDSGKSRRSYSIACHVRTLDDRTAVSMIF
jgi:hypothetical protein